MDYTEGTDNYQEANEENTDNEYEQYEMFENYEDEEGGPEPQAEEPLEAVPSQEPISTPSESKKEKKDEVPKVFQNYMEAEKGKEAEQPPQPQAGPPYDKEMFSPRKLDLTVCKKPPGSKEDVAPQKDKDNIQLSDSTVLEELRIADQRANNAAKMLETVKEQIAQYAEKEEMTEEDIRLMQQKQAELMEKMSEFEEITKRVQQLVGLRDVSSMHLGPPTRPMTKHKKIDDLPKMIVCGPSNLEHVPKIIVCEKIKGDKDKSFKQISSQNQVAGDQQSQGQQRRSEQGDQQRQQQQQYDQQVPFSCLPYEQQKQIIQQQQQQMQQCQQRYSGEQNLPYQVAEHGKEVGLMDTLRHKKISFRNKNSQLHTTNQLSQLQWEQKSLYTILKNINEQQKLYLVLRKQKFGLNHWKKTHDKIMYRYKEMQQLLNSEVHHNTLQQQLFHIELQKNESDIEEWEELKNHFKRYQHQQKINIQLQQNIAKQIALHELMRSKKVGSPSLISVYEAIKRIHEDNKRLYDEKLEQALEHQDNLESQMRMEKLVCIHQQEVECQHKAEELEKKYLEKQDYSNSRKRMIMHKGGKAKNDFEENETINYLNSEKFRKEISANFEKLVKNNILKEVFGKTKKMKPSRKKSQVKNFCEIAEKLDKNDNVQNILLKTLTTFQNKLDLTVNVQIAPQNNTVKNIEQDRGQGDYMNFEHHQDVLKELLQSQESTGKEMVKLQENHTQLERLTDRNRKHRLRLFQAVRDQQITTLQRIAHQGRRLLKYLKKGELTDEQINNAQDKLKQLQGLQKRIQHQIEAGEKEMEKNDNTVVVNSQRSQHSRIENKASEHSQEPWLQMKTRYVLQSPHVKSKVEKLENAMSKLQKLELTLQSLKIKAIKSFANEPDTIKRIESIVA